MSLLKRLLYAMIFFLAVFRFMVRVFKVVATTGKGSSLCLKNGFLPVPVNFHSPIPDIADLEERGVWNKRTELRGIDFREDKQIELLKELAACYSDECRWSVKPTGDPFEFHIENPSFSYGCAVSTHCMIRHFKPRLVIEIGSGMSSRVISKALKLNKGRDGKNGRHIVVDPYASDTIRKGLGDGNDLVESRVELLDPRFFEKLDVDDILFIDSGHCVRIGGDVNFLFLEVIPRLKPGVIVHVHDIGLPYEYAKVYATNESFRQFWTEQYLLQAFLCFNTEFEVLLAMNYLMTDHPGIFRQSFSHYDPELHRFSSGSLWMRRKRI
jgi:hypothetical protein